ncbi:MAG: hypothetical protein KJ823_01865 [Proteobacteria bacterium]|nr:hypothetical protein [Pseudomonadota bacterium]
MGGAIPPEGLNRQCTAKGIGGQAWDHEGLFPKGRKYVDRFIGTAVKP